MAKKANVPKLGLSFLNNFQICRPKNPSSMVKTSLPAVTYMLSPLNSKSFDISFPSFPEPPPSTPTKITPFSYACSSKSCNNDTYNKPRNKGKICDSFVSSDSEDTDWPSAPSRTEKQKDKNTTKKSKSTNNLFSEPMTTTNSQEKLRNRSKKPAKGKSVGEHKFNRFGSKERNESGVYRERKSISGRMEVNQSSIVVKRSVNPYEDFKKSMFEMIMEKQMFEPKELEQLLMSFLSLNSRLHHKVIIEAFTEILQEVFSG